MRRPHTTQNIPKLKGNEVLLCTNVYTHKYVLERMRFIIYKEDYENLSKHWSTKMLSPSLTIGGVLLQRSLAACFGCCWWARDYNSHFYRRRQANTEFLWNDVSYELLM